jgi:mono/diheme cytochrome c family protein
LVVLVLGVLVPALVIASAKDSKTAPGGVKLTTSEERGRNIFAERCATCHTLAAAHAVGKVGPNLDQLVGGLDPKGQKAFILNAIQQGRAQGRGQMPAGLVDGQDAQDVAAFVAAVAGH